MQKNTLFFKLLLFLMSSGLLSIQSAPLCAMRAQILVGIKKENKLPECHGDEDTPLHIAVKNGDLDAVRRELSSESVDPDRPNFYGETALYQAAVRGYKHIINCLLAAGADPAKMIESMNEGKCVDPKCLPRLPITGSTIEEQNEQLDILLHVVISLGAPEQAIRNLIDMGVVVDSIDGRGRTPLLQLARTPLVMCAGHRDESCDLAKNASNIKELLIANGADDVDPKAEGRTAVRSDYAIGNNGADFHESTGCCNAGYSASYPASYEGGVAGLCNAEDQPIKQLKQPLGLGNN